MSITLLVSTTISLHDTSRGRYSKVGPDKMQQLHADANMHLHNQFLELYRSGARASCEFELLEESKFVMAHHV